MKKIILSFAFFFVAALFIEAEACSALFIKRDQMLLGKNFDWYRGEGVVLKNNRGIQKVAYGLDTEHVVKWTSKYGSVTFNQVGKEFPFGGVNEKGLAIELLWLSNTYYEENGKASLSELEWIQYQLDNYKTAAEVRVNVDSISINPIAAGVHFIVSDRGGRSFVLDFIDGKAVISQTKFEYQALTNSDYLTSKHYYERNKDSIRTKSRRSLDRYCQLMSQVNSVESKSIEGMFDILSRSAVDKENFKTYWSIVYDLRNYRVAFKSKASDKIKVVELKSLDFDPSGPLVAMDVNTGYLYWRIYDPEKNRELLHSSLEFFQLKLNEEQLHKHMMKSDQFVMDDQYSKYHKDLKIRFSTKKAKGNIMYTLMSGEDNYKAYKGDKSATIRLKGDTLEAIIYSLPVKDYALACFQDLDYDYSFKRGWFGLPKEPYAFSNGAKGFFGTPAYKKASFDLRETDLLEIKLK